MAKTKLLMIRITPEQDASLQECARAEGFAKKSEYVRVILFRNKSLEQKIDAIYQKVMTHA